MGDFSNYKKVMVLGAKRVGKTCMLQTLINNSYDYTYSPTIAPEVFIDPLRGLMYVDTPGVDDAALEDDWYRFVDDPAVQDLLEVHDRNNKKANHTGSNNHFYNVDGYLIVYSSSNAWSLTMAKGLRQALLVKQRGKPIFAVCIESMHHDYHNRMEVREDKMLRMQDSLQGLEAVRAIFDPEVNFEQQANALRPVVVLDTLDIHSGEGLWLVNRVFTQISSRLHRNSICLSRAQQQRKMYVRSDRSGMNAIKHDQQRSVCSRSCTSLNCVVS